MIAVVYQDGSFDEGTLVDLEARQAGRVCVHEVELPDGAPLPAVFAAAKASALVPTAERWTASAEPDLAAELVTLASSRQWAKVAALAAVLEQRQRNRPAVEK